MGSPYDSIVVAGAIALASRAKNKPLQQIELQYASENHMANSFLFGCLLFAFFSRTKLLQLDVYQA